MSADSLIDGHVSIQQCKQAVDSLLSHAKKFEEGKAEGQLLPGKEQNVWLVVGTKVMHPEKKIKPVRIPVKYPIVDPRTAPVCLIVKDPQREYKDLIAAQGIKFISRVVDIRHLKGKWRPFEARRMLLKENGLFLADERVVPLLPDLLGKVFFQAKKQPIPVRITSKDLKGELERAISSTYFHQNQGTCASIKVGTVSQKPAHVLANLQTALPEVMKHLKGGWDNVQSILIKTNSSAALPIWQCALSADSGGRWDGLMVGLSEDEDEEAEMDDGEASGSGEDEEMEVDVEKPATAVNVKGKKRAAEEVETLTEKEKPKKKAKAAEVAVAVEVEKPKKDKASRAHTKEKGKAVQPVVPAPVEPVPSVSEQPVKKKHRKSEVASASAPAAAPAAVDQPVTTATSAPVVAPPEKDKRKRKKSQIVPTSQTPAATLPEAEPAPSSAPKAEAANIANPVQKEKRKKARASAAAVEVSDIAVPIPAAAPAPTPAKPAALASVQPVTPIASKKKRRASAVEFFEDKSIIVNATPASTSASAASPSVVPPNTPADGLAGETPAKRKKRTKATGVSAVTDTPVTSAIAKLAAVEKEAEKEKAHDVAEATPSGKKPRRKKSKAASSEEGSELTALTPGVQVSSGVALATAAGPVADGGAEAAPVEKKKKRKHKEQVKEGAATADSKGAGGDGMPVAPAPTSSVSAEEIKQKKRSVAGVEKKKEKVVGAKPAAKSAKDEVVGKKSKKL